MSAEISKFDKFLLEIVNSRRIIPRYPASNSRREPHRNNRALRIGRSTPRRRSRKISPLLTLTLVFTLLVLGSSFWFIEDSSWSSSPRSSGLAKAALVDELSATVPDQSFLENVGVALERAGYEFQYYGPSDVTVSLFQRLPVGGYDLVIVRAHSGESSIYTSELYSKSKYVYEQLTDQIVPAYLDGKLYFAITQKFVQDSFQGNFDGSLIVTMGCSGLSSTNMAQAFLDRGARAYVGWDRAVSPRQTDTSIAFLVQSLAKGLTVKEAVGLVTEHFAGNPSFQSRLGYYDQTLAPRQQASRALDGLGGLIALVLVMCAGPLAVIAIPRFLGKR